MLSSIAAGSSAPVGPPACPSGNQPASRPISSGIPDTSPMITSAFSPRTGSSRLPLRNSTESLSPSVSAFSRATAIACSDRSVPITRRAPTGAATNDRTPLPQPTSITVSSGPISSESAIARLVCVGWKTPSPRDTVKGPVRPFHSSVVGLVSSLMRTWWPLGPRTVNRTCRSHAWRIELGVLAGPNLTVLDRLRERLGLASHARGLDPAMPVRIRREAAGCSPEQPHRAVRVPAEQVDIAGAELREPLVELGVVGVARLLPGRLPRLVGGEVAARVQVLASEPVRLLERHRVEVLELERVLRVPGLRAAERVARAFRLVPRLGGPAGLADGVIGHRLIVAAAPGKHAGYGPRRPIPWPTWTRPPRPSRRRPPGDRNRPPTPPRPNRRTRTGAARWPSRWTTSAQRRPSPPACRRGSPGCCCGSW